MGGKEKFFTTLKDREQGGTETGCEEPKLWILDKFSLSFHTVKIIGFQKTAQIKWRNKITGMTIRSGKVWRVLKNETVLVGFERWKRERY